MTNQIFKNLKIIELSSVLAGPAVGMFFAEMGAQVIKIENSETQGDMTRSWKLASESADDNTPAYFCAVNWGKKHLLMNLQDADNQAQVHEMLLDADIVISNFKQSSASKMRLDADTVRQLNPNIIYA